MTGFPLILEQHAEQGAFLWVLRERSLLHPNIDLADLAELDGRIEAHLDALRLAGDSGWEVCADELRWEDPGEVFVAAVLAARSGDEERWRGVLEIASPSYGLSRAVVSALGWLPYNRVEGRIEELLTSAARAHRRMGIASAAVHRQDPGPPLSKAVEDPDASLRARALRAVGESCRRDLVPAVKSQMASDDPRCRFSAAWTLALLADEPSITATLQGIVEEGAIGKDQALQVLLRRMNSPGARAWLNGIAGNAGLLRAAVTGAGALGDPKLARWLIEQMHVPELARGAGEAFRMFSGLDMASEVFRGEAPHGFIAAPTDDPADPKVEMDPDEHLPWPDPRPVAGWWEHNQDRFADGDRYFLGRPFDLDWLREILLRGRQRERAAAALEIAIRQPRSPLFEVRAPGVRQQSLLRTA